MNNYWEIEQAFIQITQLLPSIAQAQKDYYEELIKSGFEHEQAMYLTSQMLRTMFGK